MFICPIPEKKTKTKYMSLKSKPSGAEHFESEVDGMVSLPLLFTQLFTISFQVHKSKS